MKTNHRLSMLNSAFRKEFGRDRAERVKKASEDLFMGYQEEYKDDPKPVANHTVKEIFPTVAMQRAMEKHGFSREDATKWISRQIWAETESGARLMRGAIKVTGCYRAVPHMFITQLEKKFSRSMGFDYRIYETGKNRGKFDMLKCPYSTYFGKLGYPELTDIFCTNDDINDANMHPDLIWARTKTLGRGGDCCDFDIYYETDKK